jgi:hypothetical protein
MPFHVNMKSIAPLLVSVLIGCEVGPEGDPTPESFASEAQAISYGLPLFYGQHMPNGVSAVNYMMGSDGTWRQATNVAYTYNYYQRWGHEGHPFNFSQLTYEAQFGNRTTRDVDGRLLWDSNQDLVLDTNNGGFSFFENNGRGPGGAIRGPPFYLFWFDDNWLARFATEAYGRQAPDGLYEPNQYIRWRPVDGSTAYWNKYASTTLVDQVVLNGLYELGRQNPNAAYTHWIEGLNASSPVWNSNDQRFDYNLPTAYHLGLMAMLGGQLMTIPDISLTQRAEIRQHYISMRSQLLSRQERSGSTLLSWRDNQIGALMNTETMACGALGLCANATRCYEPGIAPMSSCSGCNYFLRPHNVISAVQGLSSPGHVVYGPYQPLPRTGNFAAYFYLRAPSPSGNMVDLDVFNASTGQVVARSVVNASSFMSGNGWTEIVLNFSNFNASHVYEYRVWWHGTANLDVGPIRIK